MSDLPDELRKELDVPYLDAAERVVAVTGGGYWATMFHLQDGSLGAILRGGSPHVGLDSHLDMIRSTDGGGKLVGPEDYRSVYPQAGCSRNGVRRHGRRDDRVRIRGSRLVRQRSL